MGKIYELWDGLSGNLVDEFTSLDEARKVAAKYPDYIIVGDDHYEASDDLS